MCPRTQRSPGNAHAKPTATVTLGVREDRAFPSPRRRMYFQGFFLFLMLKRKDLLIKGITTKAAAPAWLGFRCLD